MKITEICKYLGLIALVASGILILCGVVGALTGEFLHVKRFSNFFWFSNSFALFGILNMAIYIAMKNKE